MGDSTHTNEAHNGYIEVYLNLGLLGLGFIALLLGQGYLKTVSAFSRDPALGGLLVAYFVTEVTYNFTEAGFRMLHLEWFFLLLSIMAASRVISLAETPSESGREFADPGRPPWATRMSPAPARIGAAVKTGLSRDAVSHGPSARKRGDKALVGGKKTNNQSRSRG